MPQDSRFSGLVGRSPAEIRSMMFDGLASVSDFAEAVHKSSRTIQRRIAKHELPVTYIGKTPYIVLSEAKKRMFSSSTEQSREHGGRSTKQIA